MNATGSKIIVVGGGPVGLTAAHALARAGIDFVLLEGRPEIVADAGSGLVLSAMGLRALAQLGLLAALSKASTPVDKFKRLDHKGRDIGDTMFFTYFQQSHGSFPRIFRRRNLLQVLWECLPAQAQSKTHANKKVSDIKTTDTGVVVSCTDGTSYEGSVVIGADGAYSVVRRHMQLMALRDQPAANEERPFLTTYRAFWMLMPLTSDLKIGDAYETHGPTITIQFFVGEDSAIMGVYEKLDSATRQPPRYAAADEQAFMKKWGHLPLTMGGALTLGQAYAQKIASGIVNLEEGVVKNWSWGGRMVLVGDAAHKFTPSTGAGCNNGIIDVVALANQLNRVFSSSSGVPLRTRLATAFKEYQEERFDVVAASCGISNQTTAMATWSNFFTKFLDLYVFGSKRIQKFFINQGVGTTAKAPIFDYIEGDEEIVGSVPWVHAIPARTQTAC